MTIEDELRNLIIERYGNLKAFSNQTGIKYTTLHSVLTRGVSKAGVNTICSICKALNISADALAEGKIQHAGVVEVLREHFFKNTEHQDFYAIVQNASPILIQLTKYSNQMTEEANKRLLEYATLLMLDKKNRKDL